MVSALDLLSNRTGQAILVRKDRVVHLIRRYSKRSRKRGQEQGTKMKTTDKSRKWMWWFLGAIGAMQLYFVRELLAAFALFVLGCGAIALVIAVLYLLHSGWAVAVERLAESKSPVVAYAKRGVNTVED